MPDPKYEWRTDKRGNQRYVRLSGDTRVERISEAHPARVSHGVKPKAAKPKAAKPKAAKPKTSKPKTSKPKAAKPDA